LLLRAQGLALKVIAYELGVSQGVVSRAIASGLKRLGLKSENELFPLFLAQIEGAAASFKQV
jgi:DNA-binding NarL/FixJ family response regulator